MPFGSRKQFYKTAKVEVRLGREVDREQNGDEKVSYGSDSRRKNTADTAHQGCRAQSLCKIVKARKLGNKSLPPSELRNVICRCSSRSWEFFAQVAHLIRHIGSQKRDRAGEHDDKQRRNDQNQPTLTDIHEPSNDLSKPPQKDRKQNRREDQQDNVECEIDQDQEQKGQYDKADGDQNSPGKCLI